MGSHVEKYYISSTTNTIYQDNLQMVQRFKNEILYKYQKNIWLNSLELWKVEGLTTTQKSRRERSEKRTDNNTMTKCGGKVHLLS